MSQPNQYSVTAAKYPGLKNPLGFIDGLILLALIVFFLAGAIIAGFSINSTLFEKNNTTNPDEKNSADTLFWIEIATIVISLIVFALVIIYLFTLKNKTVIAERENGEMKFSYNTTQGMIKDNCNTREAFALNPTDNLLYPIPCAKDDKIIGFTLLD